MNENFGQLNFEMIEYAGHIYGVPVTADMRKWKDVAPPLQAGWWYIAVLPDGSIVSCEADPMHSLVVSKDADIDIWRIQHPGPADAIRTHKWDGKKIVPMPVPMPVESEQ